MLFCTAEHQTLATTSLLGKHLKMSQIFSRGGLGSFTSRLLIVTRIMLYVSQGARDTLGPSPAIVLTFSGKQWADVSDDLRHLFR